MSTFDLLGGLRAINRKIALSTGCLLGLTLVYVSLDVLLRNVGRSIGGSEELSGYAMALVSSWGLSYGLTEMAHIRILALRNRCAGWGRAVMDAIAFAALAGVAGLVALQAWPVLEKSLLNRSHANTPLETPLWIPHSLWVAGWAWFAVCAALVAAVGILSAIRGRTVLGAIEKPELET